MNDDLANVLARIPVVEGTDPNTAVRLGGLTNVNWLVPNDGDPVVVRVPGSGTGEYIDRANEAVAALAAAEAGVNVPVVFFDAADGLMATRYLEGAVTMDAGRFRNLDAVARAAHVLHRLHDSGARLATDFQLFAMIDDYRTLLASKQARLPDGYDDLQRMATVARAALESRPVPLVPSHNDPLCENFLDTGTRMFLIDYEYAGNNDPMWDLGDLSVEAGFGPEQDEALLRAYFGGHPPAQERARMVVYKAMCDLLWTLWGVIQHVNDNPADDFWAYAIGRFERCAALMGSPGFAEQVALV